MFEYYSDPLLDDRHARPALSGPPGWIQEGLEQQSPASNATLRPWPRNQLSQPMTIAELMGEATQAPMRHGVLAIAQRAAVWITEAAASQQIRAAVG